MTGNVERALRHVLAEIRDGLRHGHFEYVLTCEVIGQGRRRLVLRAGKSYQFVLPVEECATDRTDRADRDPGDQGAQ